MGAKRLSTRGNPRVYLDTCAYNRPFDDQSQPRIWLETLAFSVIMLMIESHAVTLVTSSVLAYENSFNPDELAHDWVLRCVRLAQHSQPVNPDIKWRAEALEKAGFGAVDALHLACAEAADCDYFVTCDDRLVRRYRKHRARLKVCNPVEFVEMESGE